MSGTSCVLKKSNINRTFRPSFIVIRVWIQTKILKWIRVVPYIVLVLFGVRILWPVMYPFRILKAHYSVWYFSRFSIKLCVIRLCSIVPHTHVFLCFYTYYGLTKGYFVSYIIFRFTWLGIFPDILLRIKKIVLPAVRSIHDVLWIRFYAT